MKHINSWKNKEVFEDQLALNKVELDSYPEHWKFFLKAIGTSVAFNNASLLDLGCGVGTYKELCKRHLPNILYTGMDYSSEAIDMAREAWGPAWEWIVGDYKSLNLVDAGKYDILHVGAMLDVLPNGDEALEFLLSLGFKNIIIGRAKITEEESNFREYTAYDKIQTYAYSHNIDNLLRMFKQFGYAPTYQGPLNSCTILLQKHPSL